MIISFLRNATFKLSYEGNNFLVDPMLCSAGAMDPFIPGLNKNPQDELPYPVSKILTDVHTLLVTHTHPDHFDLATENAIQKNLQIICPSIDEEFYYEKGFNNLLAVEHSVEWNNIHITTIEGQHGSGPVLQFMGHVSGFFLESENEPSLLIMSDSILTEKIKKIILDHQPDIIVINPGGGLIPGFEERFVHMDEKQAIQVCKIAPDSIVIAMHLESIDFCTITREYLRDYATESKVSKEQLIIPQNGELLNFN